jgi:trans-aconitate methyltransferase
MTSQNPLLEWPNGTALLALLARIGPEESGEFLQALGSRLKVAYPAGGNVTLLPFPRLFCVATR